MSEEELTLYRQYHQQNMLPMKRMEYYLAQIAFVSAAVAGSKASFNEFFLNSGQTAKADESQQTESNALFANFNPI